MWSKVPAISSIMLGLSMIILRRSYVNVLIKKTKSHLAGHHPDANKRLESDLQLFKEWGIDKEL